jgi:hypothetical protein
MALVPFERLDLEMTKQEYNAAITAAREAADNLIEIVPLLVLIVQFIVDSQRNHGLCHLGN